MAQEVKVLSFKSDNVSVITRILVTEEENRLPKAVFL